MNLNKAFVLGNVTRDPEVRNLPSGQQVASFSIATNRFYTVNNEKKQDTEFHNIVCFGKLADISSRYLKKGALVLIEGRIQTRSWADKQSGEKKYRTEILAESMQLGPRGAGAPTGGGESSRTGYGEPASAQGSGAATDEIPVIEENYTPPANISLDNNNEIDVKDIPF